MTFTTTSSLMDAIRAMQEMRGSLNDIGGIVRLDSFAQAVEEPTQNVQIPESTGEQMKDEKEPEPKDENAALPTSPEEPRFTFRKLTPPSKPVVVKGGKDGKNNTMNFGGGRNPSIPTQQIRTPRRDDGINALAGSYGSATAYNPDNAMAFTAAPWSPPAQARADEYAIRIQGGPPSGFFGMDFAEVERRILVEQAARDLLDVGNPGPTNAELLTARQMLEQENRLPIRNLPPEDRRSPQNRGFREAGQGQFSPSEIGNAFRIFCRRCGSEDTRADMQADRDILTRTNLYAFRLRCLSCNHAFIMENRGSEWR